MPNLDGSWLEVMSYKNSRFSVSMWNYRENTTTTSTYPFVIYEYDWKMYGKKSKQM